MNMHRVLLLSLLLCWLLLSGYLGVAQSTDAFIAGRVVDDKGKVLPGVVVVVCNEATGFQTSIATNVKGRYFLRQLPLGKPYSV